MQPHILAIIPARGGSKGIPRKNIRMLAGKPLLAWSIQAARATPAIKRVIVSTDDAEIGAIAQRYGAEVIWRPAAISGDTATSESALLHALDYLRDSEQYEPDLVVFLQATSPLRQPNDIQKAIETLQREDADSLFSACPVHGFVWRNDQKGLMSLTYDYRHRQRRQDAPEDLIENGSIYVFKPWVLREFNNRLGGKIAVYRMNVLDSFQVDDPHDLEVMERLMPIRRAAEAPTLAQIKLLALDFDGVLTDNRVFVDQDGKEAVWCDRGDGWGIARLQEHGVRVVILSTETNPVVAARARKLNVECYQGLPDKLSALKEVAAKYSLSADQVAFVGNDVNDLDCLRWAGTAITVADAHPTILAVAHLVLTKPGGHGAVRELCDLILQQREA
jgi:YrbI family 3-deoxy-D-manno-octulosonate 8-phosphate phosphatase